MTKNLNPWNSARGFLISAYTLSMKPKTIDVERGQENIKSRLDNDVFDELQDEYLKTRNPATLNKMYLLIKRFMQRTLTKYCEKNYLIFDDTEKDELIEDMTLTTIEQYLKHPDFKVKRMSAYAHFGFIKVMYNENRKKNDLFYKSLNEMSEAQKHETGLELGIIGIGFKKEFDSKQ